MANYVDLHALRGNSSVSALMQKIAVAITIKAHAITNLPTPLATQKTWALSALQDPNKDSGLILNYILAQYNAAATSAITGAADAVVQTAVDNAVDKLLGV